MAADSMADQGPFRRLAPGNPRALAIASLITVSLLFALLAGIALFGRASDGEPMARLDFHFPAARHAESGRSQAAHRATHDENMIGAIPPPAVPSAPSAGAASQGTAAIQPPPPLPPAVVPSKIDKPTYAGHALVADPTLIEATPQGPLPRIADDGRLPMNAYSPAVAADSKPRIALVVSGLGISARETAAALDKLPPQVTLAFAPYADDVQRWVSEARRRGHEVLLEVPMEPFDFPDSDPGPHTLRAAVSEESNTERLTWSLTRFTGYAGITNLLGSRFLSDPDALSPVMTFLARRGLLFFDSGPENRSLASDIARQIDAPYVQSTVSIDAIQTAMEIDARLSDLESRARSSGSAAGTGFVYPVTIDRVSNWAQGLPGRGFVLVPPSAIVRPK